MSCSKKKKRKRGQGLINYKYKNQTFNKREYRKQNIPKGYLNNDA